MFPCGPNADFGCLCQWSVAVVSLTRIYLYFYLFIYLFHCDLTPLTVDLYLSFKHVNPTTIYKTI